MKRRAFLLLCSLLFTDVALAQTTRTPLSQSAWVDVCAAPCSVSVLSGIAGLFIGTAPPASIDAPAIGWTPENGLFPNTSSGSHVYARAISAGSSVGSIPGTGVVASGAIGGGAFNMPMSLSRLPSSAAGNSAMLAKSGPTRAYSYQGCNTSATTLFLKIYDAATTDSVTPGTTPVYAGPYAFPPNNCVASTNFAGMSGISVTNGLVYAFGSSPNDDDATVIDAGAITAFQLGYQ